MENIGVGEDDDDDDDDDVCYYPSLDKEQIYSDTRFDVTMSFLPISFLESAEVVQCKADTVN